MRTLITLIPIALVLYGTYWAGRLTGRKAQLPTHDPLPVIRAAREVVVAEQVGGTSKEVAVRHLELALDEWDLKRLG
jgi:hypothetical protein